MSDLVTNTDGTDKFGNPAALGGQLATGLQDLLQKSENINQMVGDDLRQAVARVNARAAGEAVGAPGTSQLVGPYAPGAVGGIATAGLSMGGAATSLPGPAERHPGLSVTDQWAKLQDSQDRAFIRYTEFAAYELESSELQKITEQLSTAVNSLVRSS